MSTEQPQSADNDATAFPSSWVIDVCRTCGRLAVWPFCEHRDNPPDDGTGWCYPARVKGNLPAKYRVIPPVETERDRQQPWHPLSRGWVG